MVSTSDLLQVLRDHKTQGVSRCYFQNEYAV